MCQNVQQTLVRKLFLLTILSLVKSVGINEQWMVGDVVYLFTLELEVRPESDGAVWNHVDEVGTTLAYQHRGIVAGIAEVKVAGVQVDESEEHGDEH